MKITKNFLKKIIKEEISYIKEQKYTEKIYVNDAVAKEIINIFKTFNSPNLIAKKVYEKYYNSRRTTGQMSSKSIPFKENIRDLVSVVGSAVGKYDLQIKNIEEESSWLFFLVWDELVLQDMKQNKAKGTKYNTTSFYTTVRYKPSFNTANIEDVKKDWIYIIKNICENLYTQSSENIFQFKFNNDIGKFQEDRDNLKFFFYLPEHTKVSHNLGSAYKRIIESEINKSKFFTVATREGAEFAREVGAKSYGQLISAYLATKITDRFFVKKPTAEMEIIEFSKEILGSVDPTSLYSEFEDKYSILNK